MYQFFVKPEQIRDRTVLIEGSDVNHIRNVLRMKTGDEISVSNGVDGREYRCEISALEEDRVVCTLCFIREDGQELPVKVFLFQGLPKADKMELILQKAVELGAYELIPVATERCVVKLDEKRSRTKQTRWQSIAEAAAKQSKRRIIPGVKPVMTFDQALEYAKEMDVKLIPYEMAEGMGRTRELFQSLRKGQSLAVFIGPEGGFSGEEIEKAQKQGVIPVTLGKRILRTETAGMTVMSWLVYLLEEE